MKNRTLRIIGIIILAGSLVGIWFLGGLYTDDNDSEDSSYGIERAIPVGVSQSYSPTVIYEYETKEYSIRQLRPEVFSVFAKEESFIYDDYNYAEALNNAIININPKYKIESTTALTSYYSQGSEARHLFVIVSLRNASANYNHSGNNS